MIYKNTCAENIYELKEIYLFITLHPEAISETIKHIYIRLNERFGTLYY